MPSGTHELHSIQRTKSEATERDSESEAILGDKRKSDGGLASSGILKTVRVELGSKERGIIERENHNNHGWERQASSG